MQQNNLIKTVLNQSKGASTTTNVYKAITTQNVINAFESNGFKYANTTVIKTRKPEFEGFQKHIVTFDSPKSLKSVNGVEPRLHLLNSYNGATSMQIFFGVYRLICSNGLVVGSDIFKERVLHVGNVEHNLDLAIKRSLNAFDLVGDNVNRWSLTKVNEMQAIEFAKRASALRLPTSNNTHSYFVPERSLEILISPRRTEDRATDLFSLFNILQERLIQRPNVSRAQYRVVSPDASGVINVTNRKFGQIKSEASRLELNSDLWNLTEQFYKEVA